MGPANKQSATATVGPSPTSKYGRKRDDENVSEVFARKGKQRKNRPPALTDSLGSPVRRPFVKQGDRTQLAPSK